MSESCQCEGESFVVTNMKICYNILRINTLLTGENDNMAKKRKYKPLTRKAKFRLALVIAAGLLILALMVASLVFAVKGIVALAGKIGTGGDESLPAVSDQVDLEPLATVILDPGHGGSDGGAVAEFEGSEIIEKDIDVAVTAMVKELLERNNIEVILTRDEDVDMDLKERTRFANGTDADLFVSLHCNTSEDVSANGFECYYEKQGEKGLDLAANIMEAAEATGKIETRELRTDMMYVVRFTDMPAALVEMGFMSNDEELEKLCRTSYQQILADAIAAGIMKTLNIQE